MDEQKQTLNHFDTLLGKLDGLPDVVKTKAAVQRVIPVFGIGTHLYTVQTFRQRDEGDTVFLEHVDANGTTRLVIPAEITEIIARQRQALTDKSRSRAAKQTAADRKAAGLKPGFMKGK